MGWREVHPGCEVPGIITDAVAAGVIVDCSEGDDVCASFQTPAQHRIECEGECEGEGYIVRLWVEWPAAESREHSSGERFCVETHDRTLYAGDDAAEALRVLLAAGENPDGMPEKPFVLHEGNGPGAIHTSDEQHPVLPTLRINWRG